MLESLQSESHTFKSGQRPELNFNDCATFCRHEHLADNSGSRGWDVRDCAHDAGTQRVAP
jgi:hypothetical protein